MVPEATRATLTKTEPMVTDVSETLKIYLLTPNRRKGIERGIAVGNLMHGFKHG